MGILQASSTQNDYVLTFWLVCFVYYLLRFREEPSLAFAGVAGASLGLAILTKGTAYVYMLPFLLWILILSWKHFRLQAWEPIAAIAVLVLAINFGHLARNYEVYESPVATHQHLGDEPDRSVLQKTPSFKRSVCRRR